MNPRFAKPTILAATVAMIGGPEKRMRLEEFGTGSEAYRGRTKRLVPGVSELGYD